MLYAVFWNYILCLLNKMYTYIFPGDMSMSETIFE